MEIHKERLAMVDAAIEYYNGKWPDKHGIYEEDREGLFFVGTATRMMQMSYGPFAHRSEHVCNQEEFEQRAIELQNKPSWNDAPEWANWLAQDHDGKWWWYKSEPFMAAAVEKFYDGGQYLQVNHGKVIGNWQDTLEQRPETATKEQVMKGQEEGGIEQIQSWYEKGENPPVGEVCELFWGGVWQEVVEIIAYRNDGNKVIFWRIAKDHVDSAELPTAEFRPLRTETDKLVDGLLDVIQSVGNMSDRALAEAIINSGYRRVKLVTEKEFVAAYWGKLGAGGAFNIYQLGFVQLDKGE